MRHQKDVIPGWDSENVERRVEFVTRIASPRSGERQVERARPARHQRLAVAAVVRENELEMTAARHGEHVRRAAAVVRDRERRAPTAERWPMVVVVVFGSRPPNVRPRAQD